MERICRSTVASRRPTDNQTFSHSSVKAEIVNRSFVIRNRERRRRAHCHLVQDLTISSCLPTNREQTDGSALIAQPEGSPAGFFRRSATVVKISCESTSSDTARASDIAPTSALKVKIALDLAAQRRCCSVVGPFGKLFDNCRWARHFEKLSPRSWHQITHIQPRPQHEAVTCAGSKCLRPRNDNLGSHPHGLRSANFSERRGRTVPRITARSERRRHVQ